MKTFNRIFRISSCMLFLAAPSFAQQHPDLQQFEGVFRKSDNKEAHLQFTVKNGVLTGKQLWDGREYELVRKSDTNFVSRVEEYPVCFMKEGTGKIVKARVMSRSEWVKVDDYKPRPVASLTASQLKQLEGRYRFRDDAQLYLTITAKNNSIALTQSWDGKEIILTPENELSFYGQEQLFPAKFAKDAGGKIISVTCFEKDIWEKVE